MFFWIIVLYSLTENNYGGWKFIKLNSVFSDIRTILTTQESLRAIWNTLFRLFKYVIIILALSIATSIASYKYKWIDELIKPLINSLKSIPIVASIVLIHLIFELQNIPLIIVFLMVFPVLHSTFSNSLHNIPESWERHNKVHGISRVAEITKLYLPILFFKNKKQIVTVVGLSMKALIAAEILTWMPDGIGYEVRIARDLFDTNLMFAWLVVMTMIIIIFDFGFKKLLKAGDANA